MLHEDSFTLLLPAFLLMGALMAGYLALLLLIATRVLARFRAGYRKEEKTRLPKRRVKQLLQFGDSH